MKRLKNYGEFLLFVANEMGLTDLEKATEEQKKEWRMRVEVAWQYYCMGAVDASDDIMSSAPDVRQFVKWQNDIKNL